MKKSLDLYNYLFHYNHYTGKWSCFNRDDKRNYFNGTTSTHKIGFGNTVEEAFKDSNG